MTPPLAIKLPRLSFLKINSAWPIGRDGQNARLAAKLTGWRIDIKSLPEATADALSKLRQDPMLTTVAAAETNMVAQIEASVQKKSEGRPLTPEEYDAMAQFVDRVERPLR